jgi:hypothetical protein
MMPMRSSCAKYLMHSASLSRYCHDGLFLFLRQLLQERLRVGDAARELREVDPERAADRVDARERHVALGQHSLDAGLRHAHASGQVGVGHLRELQLLLQRQDEIGCGAHEKYWNAIPGGRQDDNVAGFEPLHHAGRARLRPSQRTRRSMFKKSTLAPAELGLAVAALLALAVAVFGPTMAQPQVHGFADARTLWGIPCALDVLSNVPFALVGVIGFAAIVCARKTVAPVAQQLLASLFFGGLVLIALGSAYFHLSPDAFGLAVDRYAMAFAFAPLLGLAVATRISDRAGLVLALALFFLGPQAVDAAWKSHNVLPWAVVQFGGMLLLAVLAWMPAHDDTLRVNWWLVIAAYALAKLAEMNDQSIFEATGQWFSGHTAKHVIASFAALPVVAPFLASRLAGQNGALPLSASHPAVTGTRQA